jgi:hypothetical protein
MMTYEAVDVYFHNLDTDDRVINECRANGGMRIGGETEVLEENQLQCHFLHHKSYVTWDRTRIAKMLPEIWHDLQRM